MLLFCRNTVLASHTIFQAATLKNEIGEMNVLILMSKMLPARHVNIKIVDEIFCILYVEVE